MAIVVNMPRLSDTMEEGTVATWLKKVGDKIEEGDILAEIETDKATMEFESFNEGTLLHIGVQEGETTKVDELLAIIGDEGEDISALLSGGGNATATAEVVEEEAAPVEEAAPEATAELPEGVIVVTMPRLSDTMEEGTVATWLKKVGDNVEEGDILAEIETDKATMEFESFQSGTLLFVGLQEGDSAKVDELLAIIGPAGTDVSGVAAGFSSAAPAPKVEAPKKAAAPKKEEAPKVETAKPAAPVAPKKSNDGGRLFVSPLAKKIAEEKGFNISDISGSGEGGRIIKRDVENFTPQAAAPVAAAAGPAVANEESFEEVKNSNMRKAIAKNLAKSKFTAPHYYLNVEFDMDKAIAFRKEVNAVPDTKVSFNDIVVKACAMALKEHPQVNSQWFDDKMRLNNHVHIGVAVAVEDGLLVPVVKFADQRKLTQIGAAVKEYAIKAKNKKLSLEEMEGSTFTISNLGMFGIDSFTSIINQPNSAILSVGAIVQKPVVKEGAIVVGNTMKLCLAADHRTIDGATGAQFLQTLKGYIENPISMLL
ncbi:pyruvate dehydrogenase complex dihydrolipoamide acetyltransferase [Algibacter pacificus]|uniref:pyruvate dehydrogenase complex dihydrolipoamide acetyltransferase n=1 Tax=Algibacter pacificus TaxID=2599389 RepID=UPI0011C7A582|nr:pyruvate dehydrogenase complex dihydrolipoamide acetyltransferase [Algibacter pacificus]